MLRGHWECEASIALRASWPGTGETTRTRTSHAPRVGVSAFERLEALVANDELYALADAVPTPDPSRGGRPRSYPVYMWVLFDALLSVWGSARQVEAELSHPMVWSRLCDLIRARFPDEPDRWLPATPMRRWHYLYGRTRWLTEPTVLAGLRAVHRRSSIDQARALGLLDPNGPGTWTHPDLTRMIHADGKVVTPLFRHRPDSRVVNRRTGEVRTPRFEPDAGLHFEGTGETAWGLKFVLVAVRSADVHGRIILDVDWVPSPGGEAHTAMDAITGIAREAVGLQGVVYDGALRGVHHQRLLRDVGIMPVNKVAAVSGAGPRTKGRRRIEKSTFVEQRTIAAPDGTSHTIDLFARAGAIGIGVLIDTGQMAFTELRRIRTSRVHDKVGTFRWYNHHRLPEHLGGGTITVRLCGNENDRARRFNRTENVQPIPPSDPDFPKLYARRNDAESINRGFDDTLWLRRAHSIGNTRQHLNLLIHALVVNSLALYRHHRRSSDPPLTVAA